MFDVELVVRKWRDPAAPIPVPAPEIRCQAAVDSGSVQLSLPAEIVETLGLTELGPIRVRTADGAFHEYRTVGMVEIELQGRMWQGRVIELPRGAKPLLGAIPLEEMDFHILPRERRLVPNPESPDEPVVWLLTLT